MTPAMLQLVDVEKRYGENVVLHPLDLDVATGKTLVILGQSGCGKSTILRLMNGLIRAERGEVRFDGVTLDEANVRAARRRMGYVIQGGGLFPHLTARQNITLAARHFDRDASWIARRADELCELTSFPDDAMDRYPKELSGGQRQRVSLMRALFLDAELLLLDEPLGALDPMIRRELQEDLKVIFRTLDKTVVLVTHDLAEAAFFADKVVLMRDGAVVQRGPFTDLLERPAETFVEQFVRAQRTDWLGQVEH